MKENFLLDLILPLLGKDFNPVLIILQIGWMVVKENYSVLQLAKRLNLLFFKICVCLSYYH